MPNRNEAEEEKKGIDQKCAELGVYVVEMTPDGHWCVPLVFSHPVQTIDSQRKQLIRSNSGSAHESATRDKCTLVFHEPVLSKWTHRNERTETR
jgi:hypothetical protein